MVEGRQAQRREQALDGLARDRRVVARVEHALRRKGDAARAFYDKRLPGFLDRFDLVDGRLILKADKPDEHAPIPAPKLGRKARHGRV